MPYVPAVRREKLHCGLLFGSVCEELWRVNILSEARQGGFAKKL